ncbi:type I secretion system permease/ATPase [Exilibacterium tricleocarpae]|uniref:Type I secretion system permease/ATPase n=1 Tax=Exilibacterium tricleocarpae TaxID=2591008 RepID=A0A545U768_9GAMM|nr:type I secretion system permease/ATPase [Exilibacterium tricleocarpae]TQV85243.1 type I secretion system permease/ATPase [Exilibacterium tricleocarpae]
MKQEAAKQAPPAPADTFHDPLLECLLLLCKLEQTPCSATALTAGLPLVEQCLTPELFVRAAARAGFSAKIVARPLGQLSNLVLPAVVLLDDNRAAVLVELDAERGVARLLESESGGERRCSVDDLGRHYSGYAIFTRPQYRFDARTRELETRAGRRRQQGHWFWGVMAKSWRIYRDVLLASLLINLFVLANPLFVMNVYDRVVPNAALETLWVLAIGVSIVYGFDLLLKTLRAYFIEVAGKKSDILLSSLIFERVLGAKLADRPASVGAFASQFREFESVRNFITSSTVTAFIDLPFVVLFLAVIAYVGGPLVFGPLLAIPVIIGYGLFVQGPLRRAVEQTFQSSAQKNATLVETLTGIETVKTLGAEGRLQRLWEKSVGHLAQWGQQTRTLSNSAATVAGAVQQFTSVVVVVSGVYLIAEKELTVGALIACVLLTSRALAPMAQVASLLVNYHQTQTALRSLDDIVNKPQERDADRHFIQRPDVRGGVQFDKVSFCYPGEEVPALDNVSFKIAPGERVAVIGRIGSGKSTVQKLVMGLYQPQEGAVLVDDIDIKQIDPADLRSSIGYVSQDITLFFGSIKDNIAFGAPHCDDAQIVRAAEIAGLNEFINSHPLGFQRPVGERGEALSGGQRQSIGVARAVLNDPPLYLLDEPTTAMDHSSEARMLRQLHEHLQEKTLLLVTHKTSLLSLVDRILVLDRGKLLADGPKESVLAALKKGQLRVA